MNSSIERLLSLKVCDAYTPDVVTISSSLTMSKAAEILRKNQVSGAPVVDEGGSCVGVLSGTDFVLEKAATLYDYPATHVLSRQPVTGAYCSEETMADLVSCHMSPAVQTIGENCSLLEAARYICNEHIHRLVVLDEHGTPVGILSSLDLVSAFIAAIEE